MSAQLTWWDLPNATSSPASPDGPALFVSLDGPTIALCGQDLAPANRSVSERRTRKACATSATSGPLGFGSSASVALRSSLVSKLRERLPGAGLTLFKMTWKESATPSRRSIYQLRASVRRTSGNDCGGWATPTATDATRGSPETNGQKKKRGAHTGSSLLDMASWATPCRRDYRFANRLSYKSRGGGREGRATEQPGGSPLAGNWSAADWLECKDGKARPVESGSFPLAPRLPNHVGRLRAYGNAIVPEVAAEVIGAFMSYPIPHTPTQGQ